MAFGLGYDKTKILQAAEKYVIQGKIQAAIDEYIKILRKDPKDLLTLNTIGDLYARVGKTDEALKYFYDLGEKYVEVGYLPRAIAVYKRITKLDPESASALLKLGELYSMQGLLRDSRTHYLQAVEMHMRRREKDKAREVFEKVLLLDMENPRLQLQMAQLYAETGKKQEAVVTYLGAIERFLDRNEPTEAGEALQAVVRLDPENVEAKILNGRLLVERGEYANAIQILEGLPESARGKSTLNWLFHAYMKQGRASEARRVATELFDTHEDFAGLAQLCESEVAQGRSNEALEIYRAAADRLIAQHSSSALTDGLRRIVASEPHHIGALELLWKVRREAGDRGEAEEAGELLAHAYVTHDELEKARDIYGELIRMEPQNPELLKLLRQVESRLGGTPLPETAPAVPGSSAMADFAMEPEEARAPLEARSAREEEIVKNCMTESDLYITYRQFPQAMEVLERGLAEVPGDIPLQEQLLRVCEMAQQYGKAAAYAEALTEAYVRLGDGERASRYGELTLSLQQKALEMPPPAVEEPAAVASQAPAESAEPQVREVDLSLEWATMASAEGAPAPAAQAENAIEEIEFYLQAGLATEAAEALRRLQEISSEHPAISEFERKLAALQGGVPEAPPSEVVAEETPLGVEEPFETPGLEGEPQAAMAQTEETIAFEDVLATAPVPEPAATQEEPSGFEAALPVAAKEPVVEEPAPQPTEEPEIVLDELFAEQPAAAPTASEFELSLEETAAYGEARPAPVHEEAPPPPRPEQPVAASTAPQQQEGSGSLLDEVFAEFKEDVGEPAAAEDDIETHYNMGVAFKEMALYDEAIGEFQKAHQLAQKAKDFSQLIQCCSLLAVCFAEKGMPELAVTWYQTALKAEGLDPESRMALQYEIGSAYENAGNREAALKSFLEVYAQNIDYRNVAERIRDLQSQ